ncbi:MAG: hypothetical protein RLZZ528_2584 [Pseudomonadota bacterium]
MTRTVILHVGLHKTGTTAIQEALSTYRSAGHNVLRLTSANHSHDMVLMFCGHRDAQHLVRVGRLRHAEDAPAEAARLKVQALRQFRETPGDFIISGEEISARFKPDDIRELKEFLAPHFQRIRVIAYVREPLSYMRSAFQEVAKKRQIGFDMEPYFPHYRRRLKGWVDIFGRDAVTVLPYDRKRLRGGSAVEDFAAQVGITLAAPPASRANETLTAEALATVFRLRRELEDPGLGAWARAWRNAAIHSIGGFGTRPFVLAASACRATLERNADEIAWIEDVLGAPLPPAEAPPAGALEIAVEDDLAELGESCRPEFEAWARRNLVALRAPRFLVRAWRGKP